MNQCQNTLTKQGRKKFQSDFYSSLRFLITIICLKPFSKLIYPEHISLLLGNLVYKLWYSLFLEQSFKTGFSRLLEAPD